MKPFLHYLTMAICLLLSVSVYAQTNVSGAISSNTTWTASGSPYQVTGDISITAGNTLSIEEGVTVNFTGNYQILVRGAIQLKGSSLNPVKFNGHSGGTEFTKYMILFRSTDLKNSPMTHTEFSGPQYAIQVSNETQSQQDPIKNTDTLSINYATFSNSGLLTKGFDPTFSKAKATLVLIKNSTIANCTIKGDQYAEPVEFVNSTIESSRVLSGYYFLGYYFKNSLLRSTMLSIAYQGLIEVTDHTKVVDSRFYAEGSDRLPKLHKSYFINSSFEMASQDIEINQCIISYTVEYAGITSILLGSGKVTNSHIIGNKKNYGIKRSYLNHSNRQPLKIENNTISSFNNAINIDDWTNGYGPDSVKVNGNNIFNQKEYYLINNSTSDITASNNYWDSTNTSAIEQLIYDFNDNVSVGTVNYTPFLVSPSNEAPISPPTNVVKYKQGNDLIIQWSANPESDLAGYKLHWGNPTGYSYTNSLALGNVLTYTIPNGDLATEYALTAYDTDTTGIEDLFEGHQSWFSTVRQPKVSLSLSDSTIHEGETKYVIATLDYPSPTAITVELSTQGAANADYTWEGNTVTIAAGTVSDSIAITHPQNTDTELTKELSIQISNAPGVSIDSVYLVKFSFLDDDPPGVTFSTTVGSVSENGGTSILTATLSAPTSNDVLINFTTSGDAQLDTDYLIEYEGKNTVSTLAGSGVAGYTDGLGKKATFNNPMGITIDSIGNLFVTAGNIRKITPLGLVSTFTGITQSVSRRDGAPQEASFHGPRGIKIDPAGNLYVADQYNSAIRKISPTGFVSTIAGGEYGFNDGIGSLAKFRYPSGIAIDNSGNIFVTDNGNHTIRKVSASGSVTTFAGTGSIGNNDGNANQATFYSPLDLVPDKNGDLFITDVSNSRVRKINSIGNVSTFISGLPFAAITFDRLENLIVSTNGRISKINKAGVLSTIAGTGYSGDEDGSTAVATFRNIVGLVVDPYGNIYVADQSNHKIRKIQRGPQIRIPAGQTTGTLVIKGIDDNLDENDEIVVIKPFAYNATLSSNEQISVTIQDNTPPPSVNLYLSDHILVENGSSITLTAKLNTLSAKDVILTLSTGGTATSEDYQLSSTTLTIPAGKDSAYVTISSIDDNLVEIRKTIILTVDSIRNAAITQPSISCYLESEDKPAVSLVLSKTSFFELEQGTITATLSEPTSTDVVINLSLAGSALPESDYLIDDLKYTVSDIAGSSTIGSNNGTGTAARFNSPADVVVDSLGNIYVADVGNSTIRKINSSKVVSTFAGNGNFGYPNDIAIDRERNIYVADYYNIIRKITPNGAVSTVAGSGNYGITNGSGLQAEFTRPSGVVTDSAGFIYVTEGEYPGRVRKISPSGMVTTLAGGNVYSHGQADGIGTAAAFLFPRGLTINKEGDIFLTDLHKIRKITPNGTVSTFAGNGGNWINDGVGTAASFDSPSDIAIDKLGNLYVGSSAGLQSNRIRKITPSGVVSTINYNYKNGTNLIVSGVTLDNNGNLLLTTNEGIKLLQLAPQIIIPAGQTTGTLTIKGIEDTIDEQDETIVLTAEVPSNATLSNSTLTLTLKDNRITLTKVPNTPFPPVSSGAVAWGDFDRDGDQDVAIMGRSDIEGNITRIYRNNAGTFVNTNQNLERLRSGDIKWVDINKDGYIDLAVSGVNANGDRKTNLYINENGTAFVLAPEFNVVQVSSSKMAWGDLDNDGDIDLAIAGLDPNNTPIFYLYEKVDEQLTFNRITDFYGSGFTGGDIKIADFDLDGDNDIIYKGGLLRNSYSTTGLASFSSNLNGLSLEVTKLDSATNYLSVLANGDINGTPQFEASRSVLPVNGTMPQFKNGDIAAGDFNNDGRVDLLFTGEDNVGLSRTELYTQETDGKYLKSTIPLSGLRESTATWVDYDVDGDLDLFMIGIEAGVQRTFLYKSDVGIKVNRPPSSPTGLKFENLGNGFIKLSWDIPTDDHSTYLGYNIRLGTTPGGSELSNTQSNLQTGSRLITETAPIHTNSYLIQLSPGQYYWSVQAIDQGFQGSPFAPENTFALQYEWKTINQGGIIDRTITGRDKPIIGLLDIDDDQDLDMILGSSTDRVLHTFNGKAFVRKEGVIGYGGVENMAVGDINNDGRTDLVINSTENQLLIYLNQGDGTLPVIFSGGGLVKSKIKIVDFDNDGKIDVLIAGLTSIFDNGQPKFYRYEFSPTPSNPSFFQFTDLSNQIVGLRDASYDFGDYDKDKDIDFIISGFDENSGLTTALYKNQTQPGSSLTLVRTTDNLVRVDNGTSDFVDYDGDGDLDILFTGRSPEGNVFEIYENRLSGNVSNWVNISIGLDPIRNAKIDLGDFDGDGYNDLLYTGFKEGVGKKTRLTQFNPTTKKYVESTFDLGNIIDAEVEFGDIDADGDLDMIIAGTDATNIYNRTFKAYLNVRNESAKVTAQAFAENKGNDRPTKGGAGQTSNAVANYTSNQPPAAPLPKPLRTITTSEQKQLEFSWNATTDDHTPSAGLTYNLRIGKSTTGNEILPSNANSNGNRKIVARGNTEHNTSWVLNNLEDGTYYWSVQALDASYIGSAFSTPQKFEIKNGNLVTYEPPVVTDLIIRKSAPEPVGSVLGKVIATDPENDVLSYAITAGDAQGWFSINSSGEIIVLSAPATYPDSVKLTVTVSDGSNTITGSVTVFICSVATVHQTLKSGNWNDISVWSCGSIPTIIHAVRVNATHIITLPENITGLVKSLELGGQLQYNLNSNIQVGQE